VKHVKDKIKKQLMILADKNLEETESNIIQIYKVNITINLQIFIKYSLKN